MVIGERVGRAANPPSRKKISMTNSRNLALSPLKGKGSKQKKTNLSGEESALKICSS